LPLDTSAPNFGDLTQFLIRDILPQFEEAHMQVQAKQLGIKVPVTKLKEGVDV
jgi:hypothetical protein